MNLKINCQSFFSCFFAVQFLLVVNLLSNEDWALEWFSGSWEKNITIMAVFYNSS